MVNLAWSGASLRIYTSPLPAPHVHAGSNGGVNGNSQVGNQVTGMSSAALNAASNTDTQNKKRVGVIPQESILPAGSNPLAGSAGIADPNNLKGATTNTP